MLRIVSGAALAIVIWAAPAAGQTQDETPPAAPAKTQPAPSDRAVDPAQPDFTLLALPTTLRIPRFAGSFRVTHRFSRSLGDGNFGDLLGDAFGVDGGARVGLEFRFGLRSGTQIGIHRTSDRTIQFFGQQQFLRQGERMPLSLDVIATAEGTDNFRDHYSPAVGVVLSRSIGRHGAVYVQPIYVNNSNFLPKEFVDDNDTYLIGFGGRLRIRSTFYIVAEAAPRFGFTPDATHVSFGVEKRWGGHLFQVNFSNSQATTLGQLAQGGFNYDDWFLGFNISRKFF